MKIAFALFALIAVVVCQEQQCRCVPEDRCPARCADGPEGCGADGCPDGSVCCSPPPQCECGNCPEEARCPGDDCGDSCGADEFCCRPPPPTTPAY